MPDPPGTIDGAKNPELIPDDVAYRVLLLAIAEPEDASPEQKARARAKIVRAQLSEDDEVLFLTMATQYKTQIDSLAAQAAQITNGIALVHPDSVQGRQLSQLGRQQDQVLVNTIAALKSRLSVGGSEKLDAHVQSIKRKMKLYPPPPNMPAF
jgi:sulfur transfer protein SufE